MASASQHRCVFVGNIPYDATEEQLIEICREVGPVVSFRLVIDRETGKPKGYGFCEYKDEETALSARRNLQGYEINGRQLRVDFAENDKNADRNREQGRGGPGLASSVDPQKQVGGTTVVADALQHQPIGLHIAITAANVMTGALGGAQIGMQSNQNGLQSQLPLASDPLTLHLAKMSRSQLNEIMSQLKVMATQNREAARQLLLLRPQLPKALFQAQIMLGMVTPQMLQMPNIRQWPGQPAIASLQDTQQGHTSGVQNLLGLPPLAQRMQSGLVPKTQEVQLSSVPQNSSIHNQFSVPQQLPMHPQNQIPQHAGNHVPQQAVLAAQSGVPPLPLVHPSVRPQLQVASSLSLNPQVRPLVLQQPSQVGAGNFGLNSKILPNMTIQSSGLRPTSDAALKLGQPILSSVYDVVSKVADRSALVPDDVIHNAYSKMQTTAVSDSKEPNNRPSKLLKLDNGRSMSSSIMGSNVSNATRSGPSQAVGVGSVPAISLPRLEESQPSGKQVSQVQLPEDVESALLQQVLNLTPEQLNSLPLEQRQQVIQLQQALRGDQMQHSWQAE